MAETSCGLNARTDVCGIKTSVASANHRILSAGGLLVRACSVVLRPDCKSYAKPVNIAGP